MTRPVLVDLFCCQGGAAMGYHRAGFNVIGVDFKPQPRFPFELVVADVMALDLARLVRGTGAVAVTASPPCQGYSAAQSIRGREHPMLIEALREKLQALWLPYVIENVEGARAHLIDPVMLCGGMFPGLRTYRHRLFESNIPLVAPAHTEHVVPVCKLGRRPAPGEFMHVVGNFIGAAEGREAMGVDWMSRDGLREAIPPVYTEYLGAQLYAAVAGQVAA